MIWGGLDYGRPQRRFGVLHTFSDPSCRCFWELVSTKVTPNVVSVVYFRIYSRSSFPGTSGIFCSRDRSLVRGGASLFIPISLLERGVSDGTYVGSTLWLEGGSRGENPGAGVSKTC